MLKRLFDRFAKGAGAKPDFQIPAGNVVPFMPAPTRLPHTEPPAEDYPVNCLSPGLRKVIEAIANMTQAPSAIAAQSVLSVVSLAFASRVKVETLGSPANASCFFVLIALSGERKSAADKLAMDGINRTVLEIRAEHERALQEHKQLVSGLERGEERPPQPVCPSFLVTEPTIEGAYKAIESEAGILGWFTDEAASFWGGHSMSKEKQALTCGTLSKFWDGSFSVRPRASQAGDGFVPPTPTTVNLMFQPILIPGTYGDAFLLSQGLLARMLPAWPESRMGTRAYRPSDASDRVTVEAFQDASADALRRLHRVPRPDRGAARPRKARVRHQRLRFQGTRARLSSGRSDDRLRGQRCHERLAGDDEECLHDRRIPSEAVQAPLRGGLE